MTNEELNESVQGYLKRRDSLVQLKEEKEIKPNYGFFKIETNNEKSNGTDFVYLLLLVPVLIIALIAPVKNNDVNIGIAIVAFILFIVSIISFMGTESYNESIKQLELKKQQKLNSKRKKKIRFDEDDLLDS